MKDLKERSFEFSVRIVRLCQKLDEKPTIASEKSSEAVSGATQKTTQETTQKTSFTTQKILAVLETTPTASRREIAETLGDITEDGVKYHLEKLKRSGGIQRIGPDKGGHWKILDPKSTE
ncbi:MAG: hypothetical protein JJT96_09765 [Opitutales bacterium]|nr:hypothetical protein [Opitutales bacterium]